MNKKNIDWEIIIKKMVEAIAWIIKYLIEDSLVKIFFLSLIRGIKDRRFISKPIHIPNQEEEEIVMKIPIVIVEKNSNL